ncbi:MAG: peptide-methionine (S)-S-oxide reductase MsrA [Chloroflexota bacterium]
MQFLFRQPSMPKPADVLPGRSDPIMEPGTHFVNGRRLAPPYPDGFEIADVAMGCYWGAEKKFWSLPGAWVTMVGFAGGETPNPTYKESCTGHTGHAEVVRIVFDPSVLSYESILRVFWESHDPTQGYRQGNDVGTQYRSALYTHGEAQQAAAEASRALYQEELAKAGFGAITTEIEAAGPFYFAEEPHQQYLARNPDGYDCHTATGIACPIGVGVRAG